MQAMQAMQAKAMQMSEYQRCESITSDRPLTLAQLDAVRTLSSYIEVSSTDARLDSLFLAMPISWKGTLQQYAGRFHRLNDQKRIVQAYDFMTM